MNELNNRWFGGRPIYAELSPVTDFREACCRQYEMGFVLIELKLKLKLIMFLIIVNVQEVDFAISCI